MHIDPGFKDGFVIEALGGATWTPITGGVHVKNASSTSRRTRWFPASPGETFRFGVGMGGARASMRLYTVGPDMGSESVVAQVDADDISLKYYGLDYTVPVNGKVAMVGVGYLVLSGNAVFSAPTVQSDMPKSRQIIAGGLIDVFNGILNQSFPSFGIDTIDKSSNHIRVTLEPTIRDNSARPLVFVTDGTPRNTASPGIPRASNISFVDGRARFDLFFANEIGQAAPPSEENYIQFSVIY